MLVLHPWSPAIKDGNTRSNCWSGGQKYVFYHFLSIVVLSVSLGSYAPPSSDALYSTRHCNQSLDVNAAFPIFLFSNTFKKYIFYEMCGSIALIRYWPTGRLSICCQWVLFASKSHHRPITNHRSCVETLLPSSRLPDVVPAVMFSCFTFIQIASIHPTEFQLRPPDHCSERSTSSDLMKNQYAADFFSSKALESLFTQVILFGVFCYSVKTQCYC